MNIDEAYEKFDLENWNLDPTDTDLSGGLNQALEEYARRSVAFAYADMYKTMDASIWMKDTEPYICIGLGMGPDKEFSLREMLEDIREYSPESKKVLIDLVNEILGGDD